MMPVEVLKLWVAWLNEDVNGRATVDRVKPFTGNESWDDMHVGTEVILVCAATLDEAKEAAQHWCVQACSVARNTVVAMLNREEA